METVWMVIGLTTINVAWLVGLFTLLKNQEAERRDQAIRDKEERKAWATERHGLLERIQRPEYRPIQPTELPENFPGAIQDDIHLVGHAVENYGEDDAA